MMAYRLWLPYQLKINHLFWHRNYFVGNYSPSRSVKLEIYAKLNGFAAFFSELTWLRCIYCVFSGMRYFVLNTIQLSSAMSLVKTLYSIIIAIQILNKIMHFGSKIEKHDAFYDVLKWFKSMMNVCGDAFTVWK